MKLVKIIVSGLIIFTSVPVFAEPYLAIKSGKACNSCHVSPTGGGMRTAFGVIMDIHKNKLFAII